MGLGSHRKPAYEYNHYENNYQYEAVLDIYSVFHFVILSPKINDFTSIIMTYYIIYFFIFIVLSLNKFNKVSIFSQFMLNYKKKTAYRLKNRYTVILFTLNRILADLTAELSGMLGIVLCGGFHTVHTFRNLSCGFGKLACAVGNNGNIMRDFLYACVDVGNCP